MPLTLAVTGKVWPLSVTRHTRGHLGCVQVLVEHGSVLEHVDKHGRTPIELAAVYGDERVVRNYEGWYTAIRTDG